MVPMVPESMMVFAGNANPKLAQAVTEYLHIPLGRAAVSRFSDGEVSVQLLDTVRGKDVFVLQSTCAPTNDNLMELLIMVDALKRASARRITAAIPYYGYARQDRVLAQPAWPFRQSWLPTCSNPPVLTTSSQWTSTPIRFKASSTSPSTTSMPRRCFSRISPLVTLRIRS